MTDNTEALERAIDDYLDGYVLEGDDGYHLPAEHEKLIVKDAIMGLLEEPEFRAALAQRQQVPDWRLIERVALIRMRDDVDSLPLHAHKRAVVREWLNAAADATITAAPSAQAEPALRDKIGDLLAIGSAARTDEVILTNLGNLQRRAACLSAVEREFFTREVPGEDEAEPGEECDLNWGDEPEDYINRFSAALASAELAVRRRALLTKKAAMQPTHQCTRCGALWRQCDDGSWNLRSDKAGPCCDNAAMGEQIKPLAAPSAQAEPVAEEIGHLHSNGDFCQTRKVEYAVWPVPLFATAPTAQAEPQCTRSHPHEDMSAACEALTIKARADNRAAQAEPQVPAQRPPLSPPSAAFWPR